MNDTHPALIAALAQATSGPTEGVRVRSACGFAPSAPFVAEVTTLTPVGIVTVTGHGPDAEAAVDAARAQVEQRIVEIAPPEVRERLRSPEQIGSVIEGLLSKLFDGGEHGLLELMPGDPEETSS